MLRPGDEILVTEMEHHANLVPWQELARRTGATLRWVPVGDRRRARPDAASTTCSPSAPRSSPSPTSPTCSARSTRSPSSPTRAHAVGALVVVDACQSVPHLAGRRRRRSAPTSSPSAATRCTARWGSACSGAAAELLDGHAAVPHRRLDDRARHDGALDLRARRRRSSRPACPTPPRPSASAAAVRWIERVGIDRIHAPRGGPRRRTCSTRSPQRPWVRVVGPAAGHAARRRRRVRRRRGARPRRRPGPRRRRRGRPGRAPLRVAAAPSPRRGRDDPRLRSPSTTPSPRSTRCSRRSTGCRRSSGSITAEAQAS